MSRRSISWLAAWVSLALMFAGCSTTGTQPVTTASWATTALTAPSAATSGSAAATPAGTAKGSAGAVNLMAAVKARDWSAAASEPLDSRTLAGIRRFSAALFASSAARKGNVMVSPASVFLALAMTLNGAASGTRDAMLKTLADQGITVDMINQASRALTASLTKTGSRTSVAIANSIWFRDGFKPAAAFLQANADHFRAGATRLDFADPAAPGVINAWVNENTRGLIKTLVEQISPSTVMFLINTLYFKSEWQAPFEKAETRKAPFQTPSGTIEAEFMHRTGKMRYFTAPDAAGVALPYDDGQYAYFAILPDKNRSPRDWLAARKPDSLFEEIAAWMDQKANFTVSLTLPRYEAADDDSLVDDLTALGMGVAFNGATADFSLLSEAGGKGLYISEVKHKTVIRVDEKGTEAAAATSVAIDESLPAFDKELTLDRPFIYGIMDMNSRTPLFVGILENPAA